MKKFETHPDAALSRSYVLECSERLYIENTQIFNEIMNVGP